MQSLPSDKNFQEKMAPQDEKNSYQHLTQLEHCEQPTRVPYFRRNLLLAILLVLCLALSIFTFIPKSTLKPESTAIPPPTTLGVYRHEPWPHLARQNHTFAFNFTQDPNSEPSRRDFEFTESVRPELQNNIRGRIFVQNGDAKQTSDVELLVEVRSTHNEAVKQVSLKSTPSTLLLDCDREAITGSETLVHVTIGLRDRRFPENRLDDLLGYLGLSFTTFDMILRPRNVGVGYGHITYLDVDVDHKLWIDKSWVLLLGIGIRDRSDPMNGINIVEEIPEDKSVTELW